MADDQVNVTFGADSGPLKDGVNEAGAAVQSSTAKMSADFSAMSEKIAGSMTSVHSAVKEGFGGIDAIMASVKGAMAGITAVIAGGAAFKEAVNATQEWDKESMKLAATMGITTEKATSLIVAGTSLGISSEMISGAMKGMTRALGTNEKSFTDLGIATRDSNGHYRDALDIMLDANRVLADTKEGFDRDIAGKKLYGRSWDEVRKIVKLTEEGMAEAAKRADALGLTVGPQGVAQTAAYGKAMREMKETLTALWKVVGDAVIPILTKLGEWFNEIGPSAVNVFRVIVNSAMIVVESFAGVLTTLYDVVKGVVAQVVMGFVLIGKVIVKALSGDLQGAAQAAKSEWADMQYAWKDTLKEMDKDASDSNKRLTELLKFGGKREVSQPKTDGNRITGDEGKKDAKELDEVAIWKEQLEQKKEAEGDFFKDSRESDIEYWEGKKSLLTSVGNQLKNDQAKIDHEIFALKKSLAIEDVAFTLASLKTQQEDARSSWEERMKFATAQVDFAASIYGKDTKEYQAALLNQQKMKQQQTTELMKLDQERLSHQATMNKISLGMEQDNTNFLKSMGAISDAEAIERTKATNEKIYQLDRQLAVEQTQLANMTVEQKLKAEDKLLQLDKQHARDMAKANDDAALESSKKWETMYSSITSSMTSALKGMITGTMTFQKAMVNIAKTVLDSFIDMGAKIAFDWVKNQLFMTSVTAAQKAQQATLTATSDATAEVSGIAKNVSLSISGAALAAVMAMSSVAAIPVTGWAMAPAVGAETLAQGLGYAAMASAAGGYDIPAGVNPVTQLHAQEMVLPAHLANAVRGMTGGGAGGGTTHVHHYHINAMDSKSFEGYLKKNTGALAGAMAQHSRNFKG